jgi:hypothetical protein
MSDWKETPEIEELLATKAPPAPTPGIAGDDPQTLLQRAYAARFSPDNVPPADEVCMSIGKIPIAARGNLTVIQGKSKVGKSALVSAVLAAGHRADYQAHGDTLQIEWQGEGTGAILHLDTEQSPADWHGLVTRSLGRSGRHEVGNRIVSLPLVMFARSERLKILEMALERERAEQGSVDLVILDGIADLCTSPNDEAESLELVSRVHALCQEFACPVFCIIHENPGTDQSKTRGHLGSELNRKAFANIRVDKDAEGVSTIYGVEMRKRDIPKEQGFCFAWDNAAGMHTFQGRAAGLKAAQREEVALARAREEWRELFDNAAELGTNGICPLLTIEQAVEVERDTPGTKKKRNFAAMKIAMRRAETLGALRKAGPNCYTLAPEGQSGQMRDNRDTSRE